MTIDTDFTVAVNGDIRTDSPAATYTVLELHRFLQDLADDAAATGDDLVDITSLTPSERSTDSIIELLNNYNIDDDAAEWFYGGSITQDGGDTVYSGLKVLGAVNDVNTQLMVIQDDGYYQYTTTPASPFWGDQSTGGYNGDAVGGVLMRVLVKTRTAGCDIDLKNVRVQARAWGDSYDFFNVTLGQSEGVAAVGTTPDAQNDTAIAVVQAWAGGDIPTNTEGYQLIDILNGNGDFPFYSKWTYNTNSDFMKAVWEWIKEITGNDSPEAATPHGRNGELFLGVTHSWDYQTGAAYTEDEEVVWGTGITYGTLAGGTFTEGFYCTIGALGAAGRVMYDNGSTQMTLALEDTSITVSDAEVITEYDPSDGSASGVTAAVDTTIVDNDKDGGSGVLLAATGGATGTLWIQLTTGKAPADTLTCRGLTSAAEGEVDGSVSIKTVPKVFLGSYTGSLIGAYGIGIDPDDLLATDTVTPLVGATQTPPNNVTFSLSGLTVGEDRVLVGKKDTGNVFDWEEMTIDTGGDLDQATGETSVLVTPGVPADAPATGVLRIVLDDGRIRRIAYTSHNGSDTFTIGEIDWSGGESAAAGNGVMLAFIDKMAASDPEEFVLQYNAPRTLWIRVRDGGATPIKTFESQATLGATGGSAVASRISDA